MLAHPVRNSLDIYCLYWLCIGRTTLVYRVLSLSLSVSVFICSSSQLFQKDQSPLTISTVKKFQSSFSYFFSVCSYNTIVRLSRYFFILFLFSTEKTTTSRIFFFTVNKEESSGHETGNRKNKIKDQGSLSRRNLILKNCHSVSI